MRSKEHRLVDILPAYFLFDRAILGNFALTTPETRFILNDYALEYEGSINTPGHHFNQVCDNIHFPKRNPYSQSLSYPFKAIPGKHPYCFYLDIQRAFAQIASVFGMDCSHEEGRYMAFGTTDLPEIFNQSKIMRALLVTGVSKQSSLTEWKNHELKRREFNNRHYAPMLTRAIYGTLHAIAHTVGEYTIYHHTDGFIVPYPYLTKCCRLLDERGIEYSIKHEGITEVYATGQYRIGQKHTRYTNRSRRDSTNIRSDASDWWIRQWDRGKEFRS